MRLSLGPTCGWGSDAGGIWSRIVVSRKYFVGSVLTFCKSFWYLLTFFFFMYLILFFLRTWFRFCFCYCINLCRSAFLTLFFWIRLPFLHFLSTFLFFLCCCFGCWQLGIVGHACAAHAMRFGNLQICQFSKQLHTHTVTVIHHHAMTTTTG